MALNEAMQQLQVQKHCIKWIYKYFRDCVISTRDIVSFSLGIISVFSWGVAEIPQIITNCREKTTEGVSLAFLMTWVVGDLFNLVGCHLEPATLPTQLYTAVLYTVTTIVLVGQTLYYDHWLKWRKRMRHDAEEPLLKAQANVFVEKQTKYDVSKVDMPTNLSQPEEQHASAQLIPSVRPRDHSRRDHLHFMSARSLSVSHTPTLGSFLSGSRSGQGAGYLVSHLSLPNDVNVLSPGNTGPVLARVVTSSVGFIGGLALYSRATTNGAPTRVSSFHGRVLYAGSRRLLQLGNEMEETSTLGEIFGWFMAAIYMGGRLPQIWLNSKRGTVEGLNPLMFMFALVGNAAYVGSILFRTLEWERLKPNLPWLVDAAVCVLLDLFILTQFLFFYLKKGKRYHSDESSDEAYEK